MPQAPSGTGPLQVHPPSGRCEHCESQVHAKSFAKPPGVQGRKHRQRSRRRPPHTRRRGSVQRISRVGSASELTLKCLQIGGRLVKNCSRQEAQASSIEHRASSIEHRASSYRHTDTGVSRTTCGATDSIRAGSGVRCRGAGLVARCRVSTPAPHQSPGSGFPSFTLTTAQRPSKSTSTTLIVFGATMKLAEGGTPRA